MFFFFYIILKMVSIFKLGTYAKLRNTIQPTVLSLFSLSFSIPDFVATYINAFSGTTKLNTRSKIIS